MMELSEQAMAGRSSRRLSGRRKGLTLIEVIFAAAIAVIGLAMLVPLLAEQEATDDLKITAEIMRGHARTASNLAVSDMPLFGRQNDPGNPFTAATGPSNDPIDTDYQPYSLLRAVLRCMDNPDERHAGSYNPGGGLVTFPTNASGGVSYWGDLTVFNEDIEESPGNPHESLLTLIAQRRAVSGEPNGRNRAATQQALDDLERYDSIWRMLSAHCTYFNRSLSATGFPSVGGFQSDEWKVAYSTGDIEIDPVLPRGTFQCVDAAYLDGDGRILPPQFPNRLDTGNRLRQFNTAPVSSDRVNGRVRFVRIDSDTCIGARLFADAMGGIHWKTSLGVNEVGREARVSFFIGFADTDRALEMAEQVSRTSEESALLQASIDPAFKLKVYALPLLYSSGAQAQTLARKIGPAALITTRGTYESTVRNNIRPRTPPIAFREPHSQTPLTNTFIPWPLQDPNDVRSALLLRENTVLVDSSRFENSAANAWLSSFVGEQRSAEEAGIPANAVSLNYDVFHATALPGGVSTTDAHALRTEDGRYDTSGFSDRLMRSSLAQMNTLRAGSANVPSTTAPSAKPEGIDNTAIPIVGGSTTGAVQRGWLSGNPTYADNSLRARGGAPHLPLGHKFGTQDTNGTERLWPRLLDIGSADVPVRRLVIRDDATFSQLRVRSGAQVRVIGDIAIGVTCAADLGVTDKKVTDNRDRSGGTAPALVAGEKKLIAYLPKRSASGNPGGLSYNANRYQPLCRDTDTATANESAVAAEQAAEVPYIGLYMRPSYVDTRNPDGTRTSFFTENFSTAGGGVFDRDSGRIPLSVRRESGRDSGDYWRNVIRYKGCVRDKDGDAATIPPNLANPSYDLDNSPPSPTLVDIPGGVAPTRQTPWDATNNPHTLC